MNCFKKWKQIPLILIIWDGASFSWTFFLTDLFCLWTLPYTFFWYSYDLLFDSLMFYSMFLCFRSCVFFMMSFFWLFVILSAARILFGFPKRFHKIWYKSCINLHWAPAPQPVFLFMRNKSLKIISPISKL